ncbi:MAG: Gfo/Idh/MocA family oxidoreductase [Mariniblastus sp.]|nr:Gfo/Idh/MocA family oxidoreductase [Mariniblastus sp.]
MTTGKSPDRRRFIKSTAKTVVAGSLVGSLVSQPSTAFGYHTGVDDKLRIGLVGCGGRGTGAVINALKADSNSEVTAVADAFQDRIDVCLKSLGRNKLAKDRMNVTPERQFTGFDCAKNLVDSDVDVVILATPPYFRPSQLRAAVEAGKHVFCEKPVAVDAPGVRHVEESCKMASEMGTSVVSGLCWRYDDGVRATMEQIQGGLIGDILTIQENYLTGTLWHRGENPEWSEMEYQMRNWLYYNWLSGDHIAEQHIHSLDKAVWLMGDEAPSLAYGSGGRLVRTQPKWGNIYDHFSTCYEWDNGVKAYSYCRQMAGCFNDVEDYIVGTEGTAKILKHEIRDANGNVVWKFDQKKPSMYDVEHVHLFRSIRQGQPINNGDYMCKSTLMAIMGREASYTGKKIEWDKLHESDVKLGPENWAWGDYQPREVAKPG